MVTTKPVHSLEVRSHAQRAAAYVRVSTNRQAEHETSLADQVAAITAYCEARNIELAEVFREPGASATDDNRPQFQAMIEAATARERPYDLIIVHSFSRFFRDQFEFERYRRKLAKAKVELISITQDVGEGATGDLVRSILSKFDEYQSAETAKHVRRSMVANARDGFWNGSRPPLGYKVVIAERRGDKDKKVLAVDETEAPLVRQIFSLYLEGDGASGPLGIKKIVSWLNPRNYTYRGKPFHVSNVDAVLRRTTYAGTHYFNQKDSRSGERRPREEWVPMAVPPIIDEETFQSVQARLGRAQSEADAATSRLGADPADGYRPLRLPWLPGRDDHPHRQVGPVSLLCLLAPSHARRDRLHRSLDQDGEARWHRARCARGARAGTRAPAGLARQPFSRRATCRTSGGVRSSRSLRAAKTNSEGALNRLYELVEQGLASPSDRDFAERLTHHRQRIAALSADIASLERQLATTPSRDHPGYPWPDLGTASRRLFGAIIPALRQAYVRLLIDEVIVEDEQVHIRGSRKALERAVIAAAASARARCPVLHGNGAPGRIRTCDPKLRRLVLCPTELRARVARLTSCIAG